ncbi:SGNH/GDSL hydrolase family protein [Cutibacterium acnes]|uniref:SGNH/GDSL hydrolase family protein n=1 Tax=Cutibacterium acnes TaxID=1747 RepID=UPI001D028E1D|nr:SGNH/GDSL hydrolase family protein [Cutibacterium acnes]
MTVLGDSYSAGNGTLVDGYPADGSYRSPKNYGSVLTRRLNREFGDDTTFQTDVRAWSGAQITTGDHTIVSQADGMDPHTHVVLMTAGGNDLDFTTVVENCFIERVWSAAKCGGSVDASRKKIDATMTKTTTLLSHIQNRLADPAHTRVILIGYPYLIPADDDAPLTDVPSTRVRAAEDEFRTRQAATIKAWNTSHALKVTYTPPPASSTPTNPNRWFITVTRIRNVGSTPSLRPLATHIMEMASYCQSQVKMKRIGTIRMWSVMNRLLGWSMMRSCRERPGVRACLRVLRRWPRRRGCGCVPL